MFRLFPISLLSVSLFAFGLLSIGLFSCQQGEQGAAKEDVEWTAKSLQEKLIKAKPGETILLPAGQIEFSRSLSLDGVAGVTLKGAGKDKTILSFKSQTDGAEGLRVTADNFTVEDLAVMDAKGDAIKVQDAKGVTFRNVLVSWSDGPKETNGAYGLYPVSSSNVLIENCEVSGASDAGIYVGQSDNIIVRKNYVHHNVAGIEIENSVGADVYGNTCTANTGGVLVFDLPELPKKNGRQVRVYGNAIKDNNHPNFAPEGNIVGIIPAGAGVLVMATTDVRVFENEITGHNSFSVASISYLVTQKPYEDPEYNPFPSAVSFHDNLITKGEGSPDMTRPLGQLLFGLFKGATPEILTDGFFDPAATGPEGQICLSNNGKAGFANIDMAGGHANMSFDASKHNCTLVDLAEIEL